ncbi:hypothetical protein DP44_5788 [Burkholderia pseudomallei]|nr:hypothetical protein DP44_5788 [Burkholderia pseudomallei]
MRDAAAHACVRPAALRAIWSIWALWALWVSRVSRVSRQRTSPTVATAARRRGAATASRPYRGRGDRLVRPPPSRYAARLPRSLPERDGNDQSFQRGTSADPGIGARTVQGPVAQGAPAARRADGRAGRERRLPRVRNRPRAAHRAGRMGGDHRDRGHAAQLRGHDQSVARSVHRRDGGRADRLRGGGDGRRPFRRVRDHDRDGDHLLLVSERRQRGPARRDHRDNRAAVSG